MSPPLSPQLTRPRTPGAPLQALSSRVQGPRVSPTPSPQLMCPGTPGAPPPSPQLTHPGTPGVPPSEPSAHVSRDPGCPPLQALSSRVQGPRVSLPLSPQLTRPGTPGVPHPKPRMLTHQPPPGGSGPAGWPLSGGPGPRQTKSNGTAGGRSCWGCGQLLVTKASTSVSRPRGKTIVSETVKLEGF